jgi:adenosylcobyric acid synthase
VVVLGKPIGSLNAVEYQEYKPRLSSVIAESLARLRAAHDIVVIEGAGSPAEINLKPRDIVNMHVARLADAPVLLAGDIDRGGVFAAFVGTLALLDDDERARIAGFVVNKFRGDVALLEPGLHYLHERTGKPVLGVVPYVPNLRIADEDSVSLDARHGRRRAAAHELEIAVVRLPRISNYDDFEPLEHEPGVVVRFVAEPRELCGADLVILPGTKSTVPDLQWLNARGLGAEIRARAARGEPVLGICGGCQMLGETIEDTLAIESPHARAPGLGLLPLRTHFEPGKITASVRARVSAASFLTARAQGTEVDGYEIHMGRVEEVRAGSAPFELLSRSGESVQVRDGAVAHEGQVVGTMLHGLFENAVLRAGMLAELRARRGITAPALAVPIAGKQAEYDRLEAAVSSHLDRALLWKIAGLS